MPAPRHVLLIDDDPSIRELLVIWLGLDWQGLWLTATPTVEDALRLLAPTGLDEGHAQRYPPTGQETASVPPIDMLLLDLSFPGSLSGLPALDALIAAMPHDQPVLPVVILSGGDPQQSLDAIRHGAQTWVSKGDPDLRRKLFYAMTEAWVRYRLWQTRFDVFKGLAAHG